MLALLSAAKIEHETDHLLVRGLDYYGHTVYEAVGHEGAQDAYGGGGRYDGLLAALGGPDLPGVGFAAGLDRLAGDADLEEEGTPVWLMPLGEVGRRAAWPLAAALWDEGTPCQVAWNEESLRKALGRADAGGARWVLILGGQEADEGEVLLRDMESGEQEVLPAVAEVIAGALYPEETGEGEEE